MSITDLSRIDTSPGAGNPFAPPLGFKGGDHEYGLWLNERYKDCSGQQQHMYVLWRFGTVGTGRPTFTGPYATRLKEAMERFDVAMKRTSRVKE